MGNTFMKRFKQSLKQRYKAMNPTAKAFLQTALAIGLIAMPEIALAQSANAGAGFFCFIAQYFKQIVGTAALVVIMLWAIEHIFGVSKIHDMVMKVGIAAGVVIVAATLINNSGLTTSCVV